MNRDLGFYPVSISTSLALEGLLNTGERVGINKGIDLKPFGALYVNLRTIVRNVIGSYDYNDQLSLTSPQIYKGVVQDFEGIDKYAPEDLQVIPYLCTHDSINKEFKGKFKQFTGERGKLAIVIEESAIKYTQEREENDLTMFDIELKGDKRTICLTHHPIDLLSAHKFPELMLLESHTGKMKKKSEWSTKLRLCKDQDHMPFNKVTLQTFADNNMFLGQPQIMRNVLEKIAAKRRWNASTRQSAMLLDVRNSNEPHLYKLLKTLE